MRNLFSIIITTILFSFTYSLFAQHHSDDITGIWLTPENRSAIQIFKKGNCYYGKIVWEKEPNDQYGNPVKDVNNPNENLRNKPLHGLVIMKELCFDGKREWVKGKIYNPESGNTYKIKIELIKKNTLKVRGYLGVSLIGKTSVWKRKL